jgi:hypothetical protein
MDRMKNETNSTGVELQRQTTSMLPYSSIVVVPHQMIKSFPSKSVVTSSDDSVEGHVRRSFLYPFTRLKVRGLLEVPEEIRHAMVKYKMEQVVAKQSSTLDDDDVSRSTPINP